MNTYEKEKEIIDTIKEKYPQFPVELLDLIIKYVKNEFVKDAKTFGLQTK